MWPIEPEGEDYGEEGDKEGEDCGNGEDDLGAAVDARFYLGAMLGGGEGGEVLCVVEPTDDCGAFAGSGYVDA